MLIYKQGSDMTQQPVTTDLCALEIRIKKATAAANLGAFFGSDSINLTYNSQSRQDNFCPNIPMMMLAYYATMSNGMMKVIYDTVSTKLIKEVHFRIDIGYNGSVPLSDSKNLLVSTTTTGLSAGDGLSVYAITTGKMVDGAGSSIRVALCNYAYINLEAGNHKQIDLLDTTAVVFTVAPKTVTFTDKTGDSYLQDEQSLKAVARALNECAVVFGDMFADKYPISGKVIDSTVFVARGYEPGGEHYAGVPVTQYNQMKVKSVDGDGLLLIQPKLL